MPRFNILKTLLVVFSIVVVICLAFTFGLYSGDQKTVVYEAVRTLKNSIEEGFSGYEYPTIPDGQNFRPPGKIAAVSLTFDDAKASQTTIGVPLLNEYGVKATFYVIPREVEKHLDEWKQAVLDGQEIGNHSLNHPCSGNYASSRSNVLEDYDLGRIASELDEANKAIELLLGIVPTSFAYPCGQSFVGSGKGVQSYVPVVAEKFSTGRRWWETGINDPKFCDLSQLMSISMDNKDFSDIRIYIEQAVKQGGWLILGGHEIKRSGKSEVTSTSMLEKLCQYANNPESRIWIAPVNEVANYITLKRYNGSEN